MKISSSPELMEIRTSSLSQIFFGLLFVAVGAFAVWIVVAGLKDTSTGQPPTPWLIPVGLIFATVGVLLALTAKRALVRMQLGGETTLTTKRIIGGHVDQRTFPTNDIAAVELLASSQATSSGSSTRMSELALILKNNDRAPIDTASKGSASVNHLNFSLLQKAPLSSEATQIAEFLKVPLRNS